MKKIIMSIITACMMFSPLQVMAHEHDTDVVVNNTEKTAHYAPKTGKWYQYGSRWAFLTDGGYWLSDYFYDIDGKSYYFDYDGYMHTGWLRLDGEGEEFWLYYDPSGEEASGWRQIGGKWYYFDPTNSNIMVTGEILLDDWYMFDASGAMVTGWFRWEEGTWGYSYPSGREVQEDWVYDGGNWYYISWYDMVTGAFWIDDVAYGFGQDGALLYNQWLFDNNANFWFYITGDGTAKRDGWVNDHGTWYYFENYAYARNQITTINGTTYGFKAGGAMATGWLNLGSDWYYFDGSGAMRKGWLLDGNTWYYLKDNGVMATGNYTINGKVEHFSSSGAWLG